MLARVLHTRVNNHKLCQSESRRASVNVPSVARINRKTNGFILSKWSKPKLLLFTNRKRCFAAQASDLCFTTNNTKLIYVISLLCKPCALSACVNTVTRLALDTNLAAPMLVFVVLSQTPCTMDHSDMTRELFKLLPL